MKYIPLKIYQTIENFLLRIRDIVWQYPDTLFFGQYSFIKTAIAGYKHSRPFSHIITTILIFVVVGTLAFENIAAFLHIDQDTLIEGVVVGQNEEGDLQKVISVNPLIVTNVQLRRDIAELVYEPLLKVNQNNDKVLILAESYADIGEGKAYRFKLKEGVKWHDGEEFTADDVVTTFNLLTSLEYGNQTTSVYSKAATKINITKIDEYRVEFSLKDKNTVMPNFFEVISFKILPAHLMDDLNANTILYPSPFLNRHPIGTGAFLVGPLNLNRVELRNNESYHGDKVRLKKIIFKLYKDQNQAVQDLLTGQIHSIIGMNSDSIQKLTTVPNLTIHKSNVFYNQYWGLYFNLSESGNPLLREVKMKQAIASAINKNLLAEILVESAVVADGPIPKTSFAYAEDIERIGYDPASTSKVLESLGWTMKAGDKYRMRQGEILEFNIVYVQNPDRDKVVGAISRDLEEVGIKIIPIAKTISEVNNDHLLPSFFDILLYGVSTFIDPDRYELFHSSQIGYPNLNIASYKSAKETTTIVEGQTKRVPQVDYVLERGRSLMAADARREQYNIFQAIIMSELPVIYLYHPVYAYITNKRVQGIHLQNMTALEDRFNGIANWYLEV